LSASFTLKSYAFRKEREASWAELEALVARVERRGIGALNADELHRLPALYRAAISSLSAARAISLDKNVVSYLESLAARAYICVYSTKRPFSRAVRDFFWIRFPALVFGMRRALALAWALLVLGTITGYTLTLRDPDRFYSFVDEGMAAGRGPSSSHDELLRVLHSEGGGAASALTGFATFLFTHNAKIGMLSFALGFLAGVPTMLLLFINGLGLGAMAAIYAQKGIGFEFWAWVLPHGVTELLAVALSGAAGFTVAQRLVFPGRHARLAGLAVEGREAAAVVIGAVALFFIAALIEGFFRQLVHGELPRVAVAVLTSIGWVVYFIRRGRP